MHALKTSYTTRVSRSSCRLSTSVVDRRSALASVKNHRVICLQLLAMRAKRNTPALARARKQLHGKQEPESISVASCLIFSGRT